jgi:hypothetical protein
MKLNQLTMRPAETVALRLRPRARAALLEFLKRTPLKGEEAPAMAELMATISQAKIEKPEPEKPTNEPVKPNTNPAGGEPGSPSEERDAPAF